mgnify:CR=1 FL=1
MVALPTRASEHSGDELAEGVGAVADRVLGGGVHFAEGFGAVVGQEHRVIAEAIAPTRRPDERAVDAAFKPFDMAVGPGERERADEMRRPRHVLVVEAIWHAQCARCT